MVIGRLLNRAAELAFPSRCISCGRLGTDWCRSCRTEVQIVGDAICVRCGGPMLERGICHLCHERPPDALRGMRGVAFYGGALAFAIHGLKYRGARRLARPLAQYLITYLDAHPLHFDALVPVPLHPERLQFRGYNQSALLAQEITRARGIPLREDLIIRTRHTRPQVHLTRHERETNMIDAFAPARGRVLQGETVLLIDDVCTTGATLRACAKALRQVGAGDIWALTVARSWPKREPEDWDRDLTPAEAFVTWDALWGGEGEG